MSRDPRSSAPDHGRGALANVPGRFERFVRPDADDPPPDAEAESPPATTVFADQARSIVTANDSPDVGFRLSINPYRGCEHGCSYCFARPSHNYLGLSPGLDFETKIFAKHEAPALLRAFFARPGYAPEPIVIGANTDCYQPVERTLGITRRLLEVFAEHRHPLAILTKSRLVLRDADLLGPMGRERRAAVYVSITTLDPALARAMEPRAAAPAGRLEVLRTLTEAGVPVGVLAAPMIPGLNDHELERILEAAAAAGARRASWVLLRLPHELKEVFTDWLNARYPLKAARVLGLLRQMRGGALYDSRFGIRGRGEGPLAQLLARRFEVARRRLGLNDDETELDASQFRLPPRPGSQLPLFGS